ncbi:hypothetical protein Lesp02_61260 [Lentzea sp. NBRC 105346]|uniref:DUF6551 family protein n=1 Tax=Lentzea sp. NBRC 105346 TaxID=3032205 RepID=UPI0025531FB9|nr:DUF6551 family protein [Lentzea sp. NBRC 105346]GLZ33938.1 hypothetical protein Lesp02_61260 [Lentzea sp. NBRC 105346]
MSKYSYTLTPHRVTHERVKIADLKVDRNAQRTLNRRRAATIAVEWVPEAAGTIVISRRVDGTDYIVDGQTRTEGARLAGATEMDAEVHHGLSEADEATLFLFKNRESSRPSAHDEYRIGLTAELPLFLDTEAVLVAHKLQMGSTSTNTVGAVAGVLRITEKYGASILDRTLTVAEEAWGRSDKTWDGMLLSGIGQFLGRHGDDINDRELARKIEAQGNAYRWYNNVIALATAGGTQQSGTGGRTAQCYALIVRAWNTGRRAHNRIVLAS